MDGSLQEFHGKAIALDIKDQHHTLPLLLLIHEYMTRGRNFYQATPDVEVSNDWQDWIVADGVVNEELDRAFTFKRGAPSHAPATTTGQSGRLQLAPTTAGPSGSRTITMPFTANLAEEFEESMVSKSQRTWKRWLPHLKISALSCPNLPPPSDPAPVSQGCCRVGHQQIP